MHIKKAHYKIHVKFSTLTVGVMNSVSKIQNEVLYPITFTMYKMYIVICMFM